MSFRFSFGSLDVNYDYVGWLGLIGVLGSFIGLIGWARNLDRPGRATMGWSTFAVPWVLMFIGYLVDGLNVHGSFGAIFLLTIPAMILAVVLWIMAAMAPNPDFD